MIDKKILRKELLLKRQSLSQKDKKQRDQLLSNHIAQYILDQNIQSVGVYMPIKGEPDLSLLYNTLVQHAIILSLPVVVQSNTPLVFAKWSPGDPMTVDSFGIAVPLQQTIIQPDFLLVPCLGFTNQGYRLGYGGGFYDRTLSQQPRPKTIGVAYAFLQTTFPIQPHDIALDIIITD